ncbi:hypothetical protein K439DRAFT_1366926 [Ramaria rubella]|nr:hypothetical protein K439DRAFT_1366926 [Ramaria rubella]
MVSSSRYIGIFLTTSICKTEEGIFRGEDGRQIKFFIQKDLEVKTINVLNNQIAVNGGSVEAKVPIQGFILIEPKSPEGLRLMDCWDTPERPLRYFVPYTFVAACLQANKLLPQVFRKDGVTLRMHIHSSVSDDMTVERLRTRIWHSGGDPTATLNEADVIIADEECPEFIALVGKFDHSYNKYVEGIPWVDRCVASEVYSNTPVIKKNYGGRVPGSKRTEFTATDDRQLAAYIACRLPGPHMRGRTGNKLYQDLCSKIDLYPWAERHPWQSWRERYKNNTQRFHNLISDYLEANPVPEEGKGLHGFVRISSAPSTSQLKQPDAVTSPSSSKPPRDEQPSLDDDAEWGSQWEVKVGNRGLPGWGSEKRKVIEYITGSPEGSVKRRKTQ